MDISISKTYIYIKGSVWRVLNEQPLDSVDVVQCRDGGTWDASRNLNPRHPDSSLSSQKITDYKFFRIQKDLGILTTDVA